MQPSYSDFLKRTFIVIAVAVIPVVLWYLFGVVLIAFGAIILAMLLHLGARPLTRWLAVPEPLALVLSGLLILIIIGGTGYVFGTHMSHEFQDVLQRATSASAGIAESLKGSQFGDFLVKHISAGNVSLPTLLSSFLSLSTTFVEALIIAVISGVYLAAQPGLYRRGVILLFPPPEHGRAAEIVDGISEALRLWLLGQLMQMVLIGVLATLAMWTIGVSAPFALGLIAAIGEFIPYFGPILAAIPAVLVAITKSPEAALWTLLAYLAIHQIEGPIVGPLVQRHMVSIPPAVMLLGIVAITYLFGTVAIIFAAPIAVVVFTAVNLIYVRDALGEKTELTRKLR
jgi:predicted PurR-regulated permease PerM